MDETIDALTNIILDMFKEYPKNWVVKAFTNAYKQACENHIELDKCGNPVWKGGQHETN
jgi:hypothetical protein